MTTSATWLQDMEFDEISLVDRPANQHARVALAKRAPEEENVDYFDEAGAAIEDIDDLEVGDIVFDGEGRQFQITEEDEAPAERELETVGKSFGEDLREQLSKALGDADRDDIISKAMNIVAEADARATAAEEIAKAERDLRLEKDYIAKADTYGVPGVTAAELGPVLKRAAELLSNEDCVVLNKAFTSSGAAFAELGSTGAADMNDPFGVIEELLTDGDDDHQLSKALKVKGSDRHELIEKAFEDDPDAYDRYLASRVQG